MRLFRALCATLGALLIVSTLPSGAYAADAPTLSETFVLTKDGQLVDTLTIIDPSRTMSESACQPYAGKSSDQHVEFVTRDDATVCHMQLMYTNAENESEFSLEDSGEFIMTAHAERTLTESRKLFHPDLTLKSLSLSVEGKVQSSTAGASTSATTYEGRTFSVTSWTDTVPQMITVKGSLTPGGDPSAAATTNALKDPWGATPMPASASASPSAAPTADAPAAPESSDPPIALLVGLIVGLVLLVIGIVIVVYVVRAKRGKKATSKTQGAAPVSHERRPSPARGNEGVELYAPPAPIAPAPTSAPAPVPTERPSAILNPPQPTPRDTGFTWEHKSRPKPTAAPTAASAEAPKKRRSRKDHRPAVFPERPAQPMAGQPMPPAGMSSGSLQAPITGAPQRTAAPVTPPVSPQAPIVAPTPTVTPTPTQVSQPVVPAPQAAAASAPQQETHTESTSDSSLRRRSRQVSGAQPAASAQPAFPSRRSQRQAVHDAHVPQPIPAPDEAPAAQQTPVPMPEPPVPPVPPPPASAVDAPETMLIPKVPQVAIPMPEPVVAVEPEPVMDPEPVAEPEPVVVAEPEPVVEPEPAVAVEPEPVMDPEPVVAVAPAPVAEPEPVAEPAPASPMSFVDDAEMPTAQIRRVRRVRPADWETPESAAPVRQPEPTPQVSAPPMTPAPFEQSAPAMPSVVEQPQAPASPQMPAPFQSPAAATPFQEDWNAEISQKKEAPREQEGDKKRRRLWGWGKRRKKRNEAAVSPEPEIDEPIESSHAPMISVDAQDEDDWNDWQNWNSRS